MITVTTVQELKSLLATMPEECMVRVEMEVIPDGGTDEPGKIPVKAGGRASEAERK